jgi:hypothetical protein
VILNVPKVVTLRGGWDTNFTSSSSYSTINGSITITNGTMIIEYITVGWNCTDMSSRVSSAVKLNHLNSDGTYGYSRFSTYGMSAGTEAWFLVDPASVNVTGNTLDVSIVNFLQGNSINKWAVYRVDKNNCLEGSGPIINDTSCRDDWCGFGELFKPLFGYPNGYPTGRKYLFNVGVKNSVGLAAFWKLSTN